MTELFSVELEASRPEIVEVAIVEVAMVDEVMLFVPVRVVLPPWRVKILPLRFSVPLPSEIVLPLKVLAVKVPSEAEVATKAPLKVNAVPEAVVKVVWPVTFRVDCKTAAPTKTAWPFTVRAEVEALPKEVCPAVKAASVVEPVTFKVPLTS